MGEFWRREDEEGSGSAEAAALAAAAVVAAELAAAAVVAWRWDATVGRYRDVATGRLLSGRVVRLQIVSSLNASRVATDELARLVASGAIGPDDWFLLMRGEIKREYIRQYLLGRGGRAAMASSDWGSVGGMIADQYRYLNGFRDAVAAEALSEGQIKARNTGSEWREWARMDGPRPVERAAMYVNSAREAFSRAEGRAMVTAGMTEERRVLSADESCTDCVALAGQGWQPVGALPHPGDGSTVCLTNCQCYKEYR